MRKFLLLAAAASAVVALAPGTAVAARLCIDHHRPGCSRQIQPALDRAHEGDVLRIGPGVYRGGVTITKRVTLRGAGSGSTRIRGGGPVVTIAPRAHVVTIHGVTIRGGTVTTMRFPDETVGYRALGGGVRIEGSAEDLGATVTIDGSVIEGNRALPSDTFDSPSGKVCPGGDLCPYAQGGGAGIYNGGRLKLTRSTVRHNTAGSVPGEPSVASDAQGAGIYSAGPLVVDDSKIVENESHVRPPLGRFGEAAGIFAFDGGATIRNTLVARNRAILESDWPKSVEQQAIGGGVFAEGDFSDDPNRRVLIERSRIADNEVIARASKGHALAFGGGIQGNSSVTMRHSVVSGNRARAAIPPGSHARADGDAAGANLNTRGSISRTRFVDNVATAHAPSGTALAMAAGLWAWADKGALKVGRSVIAGNRATGRGRTVKARGAGVLNTSGLTLTRTTVTGNSLRAIGRDGEAYGAGVYNAETEDSGDYTPVLRLVDLLIGGNAISATHGITVKGGGLYTVEPVTRQSAAIRDNRPAECAGC